MPHMRTERAAPSGAVFVGTNDRRTLLTEVDFKWLMAGEGHWIDTERLHRDSHYAAAMLRVAFASHSFALRECAELLQTQIFLKGLPDSVPFGPETACTVTQSSCSVAKLG